MSQSPPFPLLSDFSWEPEAQIPYNRLCRERGPTVNPGFGFLTPPPPPVHAALRLPQECGFGMVFRICPRLTDRPPVCVPPPGSPDCGVRAGPPARGPLPIAGSTAALPSPPPPALFASARCAVSRSAPAFVCRPMSPTPKSARNNSPHPPPRGIAAGRPLPECSSAPSRAWLVAAVSAADPAIATASSETSPALLDSGATDLSPIPALLRWCPTIRGSIPSRADAVCCTRLPPP